jgi:hypothetical protein
MINLNFIYILVILALTSCASTRMNVLNEINEKNISQASVLDLARSSYLRGCSENAEKITFQDCVLKSKDHEKDIKQILDTKIE